MVIGHICILIFLVIDQRMYATSFSIFSPSSEGRNLDLQRSTWFPRGRMRTMRPVLAMRVGPLNPKILTLLSQTSQVDLKTVFLAH